MPREQRRNLPRAGEPLPASLAAVSATPATVHWLIWLGLSRLSLSLIFTAYAGVLPLVREAWGMSATKAATVQSAWQLCYLVSLFAVGILADRYGARRTYLVASLFAAGVWRRPGCRARGLSSPLACGVGPRVELRRTRGDPWAPDDSPIRPARPKSPARSRRDA